MLPYDGYGDLSVLEVSVMPQSMLGKDSLCDTKG